MKKKLLAWNTLSSLMYQIVAIICGFILPRLILQHFGSNVNGLIHSITQFLHVIAFLELGIGAVVQSSLYKPLANHDTYSISCIMCSAKKFFRRLATILLGYVMVLLVIFPLFIDDEFGYLYTATLILAMSINAFAQYYFGIVNSLLLLADQRGYINYLLQIIISIVSTAMCAVLIGMDASIQIVKLTTSLICLIRPLFLLLYVKKHYEVNWNIEYKEEPIKQKWNGIAQHVAAIVLDGTDYIVLTIFSSLQDVSIYSVYNLVIYGVKQLFMSMTNGIQALLGELWAKKDTNALNSIFGLMEWLIHSGVTYIFGCTGILIIPFVTVYTKGITDAEYYQPLFALLMTLATAVHCIRLPYHMMIKAVGHYKETQTSYIIAAMLNIGISIATVKIWGIIGVAIGTLISMTYHTIWVTWYNSKNILNWSIIKVLKQITADILVVAASYFATRWVVLNETNYWSWFIMAVIVASITGFIWLAINLLVYSNNIKKLFGHINKKVRKV